MMGCKTSSGRLLCTDRSEVNALGFGDKGRIATKKKDPKFLPSLFLSMRMMGLEPIRSHLRKILSLVRLPFRHIRAHRVQTPCL